VDEFDAGGGAAIAMHNTHESIEGFARASFNYVLMRGWLLYFSTKNTILKACDTSRASSRTFARRNSRTHTTRRR